MFLLDKAFLTMGLSDLKGIEKQLNIQLNNQSYQFRPGVISTDVCSAGVHTPIALGLDTTKMKFNTQISLKGSQYLHVVPIGENTDVSLSSSWPSPSFEGNFLPDQRKVSEKGFEANWNVLHLNRNYPQQWSGDSYRISDSEFGVNLLLPVDGYAKTLRTTKYALLFIALTFLIFFFVEMLKKVRIHPIQYLLVGLALVIFFTLLLSISEFQNFNFSYLISTVLTLGLVTFYVHTIFKNKSLTALQAGILFTLYAFIFVIMQLEDYALLIGSLGVFIILALVMYFSRKIDWYLVSEKKEGDDSNT
jgi:inner membrane protein